MRSARFDKRARLLSAAEYKHVFDDAERSRDKYFTVLSRANGKQYPRLGLAVSKKNAKLAVSRNRIKRIIRESFRTIESIANADFVVLITTHTSKASNRQLFDSLEKHWSKFR